MSAPDAVKAAIVRMVGTAKNEPLVSAFDAEVATLERVGGLIAAARYDICSENSVDSESLEAALRLLSRARSGLLVFRHGLVDAGVFEGKKTANVSA